MKTAKTGYIITSLLLGGLGILLLVMPKAVLPVLAAAVGVLLILFGVVKLIGYFSKDLFRLAFQYDLASGILLIVLGIITIIRSEQLLTFISVGLGIYVLADGLLKVQIALDARIFGIGQWWLILAAAILAGVGGSFLIFRPDEGVEFLVMLWGVCLLLEGILNLITVLTAVKIIGHQRPDEIDVAEVH